LAEAEAVYLTLSEIGYFAGRCQKTAFVGVEFTVILSTVELKI
jgi:hypothetical protein